MSGAVDSAITGGRGGIAGNGTYGVFGLVAALVPLHAAQQRVQPVQPRHGGNELDDLVEDVLHDDGAAPGLGCDDQHGVGEDDGAQGVCPIWGAEHSVVVGRALDREAVRVSDVAGRRDWTRIVT